MSTHLICLEARKSQRNHSLHKIIWISGYKFVSALFINDILIHLFIQGFNNKGTIREIFKDHPVILVNVKKIVRIIEQIDKEQKRM